MDASGRCREGTEAGQPARTATSAQHCAKTGRTVERRQTKRQQIEVDIDIARPGLHRCHGIATDISRTGISIQLCSGELPPRQRSVVLNVRIWTGKETLYRKIYAHVVRSDRDSVGLKFLEHDFIAEAIIQDLMFYQKRARPDRQVPRTRDVRYPGAVTTSAVIDGRV